MPRSFKLTALYRNRIKPAQIDKSNASSRDKVVSEIAKYGGHVIQSSLEDEAEAALQEALDHRGATA